MTSWNQMVEIRDRIKPLFLEVSREMNIELAYDTHYDAMNYEFSKVDGNMVRRIDFQPLGESIQVTRYTETYPFMPRLFGYFRRYIPLFPGVAKIQHDKIGEIPSGLSGEALKSAVRAYLNGGL